MKPKLRCVCGPFGGLQGQSRLLAATVIIMFASIAALAQNAFVRVNQVGYLTSASKRAYLMASESETGATFSVKNSNGQSLYSAPIGANQGSWSNSFPYVYAMDFDAVTAAGTYTLAVTGPIAATSPSFKVDTGTNVYSTALSNTLFYYQTERDGPNFISNALRTAAGHFNDEHAQIYTWNPKGSEGTPTGVYIDASGGWFDGTT